MMSPESESSEALDYIQDLSYLKCASWITNISIISLLVENEESQALTQTNESDSCAYGSLRNTALGKYFGGHRNLRRLSSVP